MSSFLRIALLVFSLFLTPTACKTDLHTSEAPSYRNALFITVAKGDWGDADLEDTQAVLYSAANELVKFFPNKRLNPIIVEYDKNGPKTLYKRGSNGEYIVQLSSRDRYWVQFAYQFSHELCHVLAMNNKVTESPNQWFEESLCETASLFVLKRMAVTWRTFPPYTNWKSFAPAFQQYVNNLMGNPSRQLPPNITFVEWYKANSRELRDNPYVREKNAIVANQFLSLFEQNPENWEAVSYLNMEKPTPSQSFRSYLDQWYKHSPPKHRKFIVTVIELFNV